MEQLQLRPIQDSDVELFKNWLSYSHVSPWYTQPEEWIREVETRKTEFSFLNHFIALYDNERIGFCQYYEYEKGGETWHGNLDIRGVYSIDYMIAEPNYLKKGLGKQMVLKLINLIREKNNFRAVIAQPDPENINSCKTLTSCGFVFDTALQLYILKV